jgi:hypothetical protein
LCPGDVEGTCFDNVLSVGLFKFVRIKNGTALSIDDDASWSIVFCCLLTGGLNTMPALVRKEIPNRFVVRSQMLLESNHLVSIKAQVLRVLITPPIHRLCGRQLIPLLAGNLTAPACGT